MPFFSVRILIVSALLAAPLLAAEPAAAPIITPTVLTMKGGIPLSLPVPSTMLIAMKGDATTPAASARMRATNGKGSLQITAFVKPANGPVLDQDGVAKQVEQVGTIQYQEGSVEGKTVVTKLDVAEGVGAIASYTDASLVGTPDTPGKFKVVTTGTIVIGQDVLVVTLLAYSFESPEYRDCLALLQHITSVK